MLQKSCIALWDIVYWAQLEKSGKLFLEQTTGQRTGDFTEVGSTEGENTGTLTRKSGSLHLPDGK